MRRASDRRQRDTAAIIAYLAIWCAASFAIGTYLVAFNALDLPKYSWFAIPVAIALVAVSTNALLQFRRNSEALYVVTRVREDRECEAGYFLYLRPFVSDGRIRQESWTGNPLRLIGRRTDLEGALTSQLAGKFGLSPIAIGRDKVIGAGRVLLSDDEWQSVVERLIEKSKFTLLLVSGGTGISWEIEQCLNGSNLRKTIFLWPPVSEDGAYDPAADKEAVQEMFAQRGMSVDIGRKTGEVFFWDEESGAWRVLDMKWPSKRTLPKPALNRIKVLRPSSSVSSRGVSRWPSGLVGVLTVLTVGMWGFQYGAQTFASPSAQIARMSDEEIVSRFERELARTSEGAVFARMRTDFPNDYGELLRGIIEIMRRGGSEERQLAASFVFSQTYMSGFIGRHQHEIARAEPELISRWAAAQLEALTALGNLSPPACADLFALGQMSSEDGQAALEQVSAEFASTTDAMFDMIQSGQRNPQLYEPLTEDEWAAFGDAVVSAGANPSVLGAIGSPEYAQQSATERCQVGIAFYRAITMEPDPWKRARLGVSLLSDG